LLKRGLNGDHFQAVAENLSATLVELKVPQPLIDQVMAIAGGTRADVLGQ
jgi:hemoglobin